MTLRRAFTLNRRQFRANVDKRAPCLYYFFTKGIPFLYYRGGQLALSLGNGGNEHVDGLRSPAVLRAARPKEGVSEPLGQVSRLR